MQPSVILTVNVPEIGNTPVRLIQAGPTPMRVVVRNAGGANLLLAHDANSLQNINSISDAFQLPTGLEEVFVLAPRQSLFASGSGGGGQASIAASEAIPVRYFMES